MIGRDDAAQGMTLAMFALCSLVGCSAEALAESHDDATNAPQRAVPTGAHVANDVAPAIEPAARTGCLPGMALVRGGKLTHLEHAADVAVDDLCIDVREASVAEFRACVESGECKRECADAKACPAVPIRTDWGSPREDDDISRLCNGNAPGLRAGAVDDHPVNCVSPDEARSFCAAHGKRLPNGDEWEWAARGGRVSPWGTPVATDEICWGWPRKRAGTCARAAFPKDVTPEGVFDLGGNLSEWTETPARTRQPVRFAYGASWYARDDGYVIAALGGFEMPGRRTETVGFRCAATP